MFHPARNAVLRSDLSMGTVVFLAPLRPLIAEPLVFTSQPTTRCSELFPVYSNPRHEAGGPLAANVLKCQLKPVDAKDYRTAFSAAETARLKALFPQGVCDWSKPGVNQQPVVPWASWGPSPENLLRAN